MSEIIRDLLISVASAVIAAIAGLIGTLAKQAYDRYIKPKLVSSAAQELVKTCVQAVEQLYHEYSGEVKKQKAIESVREMLEIKGITLAQIEIETMIEAAVAEFNDAFNQPRTEQTETE